MFKRILAKVLAERFVIDRGWTEQQVVDLGTQVLRGNVESIFRWGENLRTELPDEKSLEPLSTTSPLGPIPASVAAEAMSIGGAVFGESEQVDRLPDPPAKVYVRPVPDQLPGDDLRVQGPSDEPPELEIIEEPGDRKEN